MSDKVLVVDDEAEIADLIALYLNNENYTVFKFYSAKAALECINRTQIDLAILDIMLPDMDGFTLCQKIRENHTYPIIMLTAKDGEMDKINGLALGADDYVTKPFRPLELIARVKSQLRRYKRYTPAQPQAEEKNVISHSDLEMDITAHKCMVAGTPITLTPTEFSILRILLENKGKVVSAEALFHQIWQDEYYTKSSNTITAHIRHLREKLNDTLTKPKYIKTVWGEAIKLKRSKKDAFSAFQAKIMWRFCGNALLSVLIVMGLYLFLWKQRLGDIIVGLLEHFLNLKHEAAFMIYHAYFRGYKEIFFVAAIILVFLALFWRLFQWMRKYFKEIHQGIDRLLTDDGAQIQLSPEMLPFERKLNAVKQTLGQRKAETALAERRKDELVMYLAHDIRTPLTSVIGYLNLLEEAPNMPVDQRAKNLHIALEKAYRLEEMINEFFEITRYNSQQIKLAKKPVDLCFLLVQLSDEFSPALSQHDNSILLDVAENLTVCGDADKLARVFSNILKNAAAYSYPETEIKITAEKLHDLINISFQNKGDAIPTEKLPALFDKFYRLDEARISDTGGAGLGLAIAKEIILLHGGNIQASSENDTVTFTVELPAAN